MNRWFGVYPALFGAYTVVVDDRGRVLELWTSDASQRVSLTAVESVELTAHVDRQMQLYFSGGLREFDLPLAMNGTPFQTSVWKMLLEIPYGQTRTYGELARCLGSPESVRAVGRANATNPIAILVPCHRVIAATGDLTGYAGGLDVKRSLLELETGRLGSLFD